MRPIPAMLLLLAACGGGAEAAAPRPQQDAPVAVQPVPAPAAEAPPAPVRSRGTVVLVPLGRFPADLMDSVEAGLRSEYRVEVERRAPVALPKAAYYPPRRRYRAEKLLAHLHRVVPDPNVRVLGLTTVDISTTKGKYKDWGIFGYGELPGKTSVLSSFRLRRRAKDRDHLRRRVTITALHEIGHTFGLDHCTEPRCLMQDAEGSIANTDTSTGRLGSGCRAKLER